MSLPRRQPVPLTGVLELVPDLAFGQLDDRLPATPDVIVVPQLPDAGQPMSDTGVDDRQDSGVHHQPGVDARRCSAEVQRRAPHPSTHRSG